MKKVVVFSGAGMSADSGIPTFRAENGLWANYRIEEVCTHEAILYNRATVIKFYNERRKEMYEKEPNAGHYAVAELEKYFDVEVVTQNVDNLHERAGSTHITHLHGQLTKLRSSKNPNLIVDCKGWEQPLDATAADGSLLRPHIVFFGEDVPEFSKAAEIVGTADIFIVIGTSLAVYPAASLLGYVRPDVPIYLIDPAEPKIGYHTNKIIHIKKGAAEGMPYLLKLLTQSE